MEITIATLIYKSPAYLDFVMHSLMEHESNNHKIHYLIVANDATPEVKNHALNYGEMANVVIHDNPDPNEYWIQRVYRAWNRCLSECETDHICFVNSDMAFTDGWLDALAQHDTSKYIPTCRLVESERMPSLPGLIGKNFGQTIANFRKDEFEKYADTIKEPLVATIKTGAFMPCLIRTDALKAVGGWSHNKWTQWGQEVPGDQITFATLERQLGMRNVMCHDSIVYHLQRGESSEVGDA